MSSRYFDIWMREPKRHRLEVLKGGDGSIVLRLRSRNSDYAACWDISRYRPDFGWRSFVARVILVLRKHLKYAKKAGLGWLQ